MCVSDLHFGWSGTRKHPPASRSHSRGNRETLARLEHDILKQSPTTIVCLGDSFENLLALDEMEPAEYRWLTCLMAGRRWIWIAGSHPLGPLDVGGSHVAHLKIGQLTFRHAADPSQSCEISGHFHPRTSVTIRGKSSVKPCFLIDDRRVILPAYGTFNSGLRAVSGPLKNIMSRDSIAVLTGKKAQGVPMHLE